MHKRVFVLIVLLLIVTISTLVNAAANNNLSSELDHNNNLRLGNDYIVIVVNQDDNARGRFAIETTGGAPLQDNDDNKPLVYGRPKPWTSYTTVWLDGEYYVFGGETGRRAGNNGNYGEVISGPKVEDDKIVTVTKLPDDIFVEQTLTIVKSSTTGLFDSVQIKYRVTNESNKEHKIGLRIVLDTMLGANDGAPFRIGQDAVTSDKIYYGKQLPQFWQAFDSISNPTVTSQGTFKGAGVTTPDQVKFADWGSMADGVWDFEFSPGEDFTRKGEYEIDSAAALYWVPEIIPAGESKSFITNYGLGGITVVPGLLSLGITSPAEVVLDTPDKTIPIVAYVENTSEIVAKNVRVSISLPPSLTTDNLEQQIGDMEPGQISQIGWNVTLSGENIPAQTSYNVKVEADNTDSNQVDRSIKFIGPPDLNTTLKLKDKLEVINGRLTPNPFTLTAELSNSGGSPLYDTSVELLLPPGLILAPTENARKYAGDIQAAEKINIKWQVKALEIAGKLPIAINIRALNGYQDTKTYDNLILPQLNPVLYFKVREDGDLKAGDYINIDLYGENISGLELVDLQINYDSESLKPVYISRGTVFLKDDKYLPWTRPDISNEGQIKINQLIPTEASSGTIATLHMKVLNPDNIKLKWDESTEILGENEDIDIQLKNLN